MVKYMENNQNDKNLKHEKLKLHFKYIIVICSIICIGTIIIAAYNEDVFVSQVSFAGTITSIILSVIAIWLSISGDRATNDIRVKIAESTERLSDTTKNVEILNKNYENTMNTQLNELKNVQEQLTKVIFSINNVGEQISNIQAKTVATPNTIYNNNFDTKQRIALFESIYNNWILKSDLILQWIFCKIVYNFIMYYKNGQILNINQAISNLYCNNVNIALYIRTIDTYWGILNTLIVASVFDDDTAVNAILEKISPTANLPVPPILPQ